MDFVSNSAEADVLFDVRAWIEPPAVTKPAEAVVDRAPFMPEGSVPDLPVGVGMLVVAAYGAILGAFLLAFAGDAEVGLVIGVCAVYLTVYLGVPAVMLRIEPKAKNRPDMGDFFEKGLSTWTGHVTAKEALAQMLTIPAALTVAAVGIGVIMRLSA
jgi:uncharacterized membrane protein YfcA